MFAGIVPFKSNDRRVSLSVSLSLSLLVQGAAAYPENEDQQQRLREAAEGLRVATNAAAQNAIKKKLINRLEVRTDPVD